MLDVFVIPRCMMSTWQWSRPETNVCWETACQHTVTFATKVCCARTRFKAKILFRLVLNTFPAESETYNALVVMVCSGERSTRSTERITERDTAQTERILDKTCDHSSPLDSRSVSSHEKRNNIAQHPCIPSVPSCVVEPGVTRTLSVVPEPTLSACFENIFTFVTLKIFLYLFIYYFLIDELLARWVNLASETVQAR